VGREYSVIVQAHNGMEASEDSQTLSVRIPDDQSTGDIIVALENLQVQDLKAESFRITFDNNNQVEAIP
jgi:hypothetical protein